MSRKSITPFDIFSKCVRVDATYKIFPSDPIRVSTNDIPINIKAVDAAADMRNATIWFFVSEEANCPSAISAPAKSHAPRYEPIVCPQSRFPILDNVMGMGRENKRAVPMNTKPPRNFAMTICHSGTGKVRSNSCVPCLFSSDQIFIESAGMRNK